MKDNFESAFLSLSSASVYDPADDGPECEVIARILAHHPLYIPGVEKRNIEVSRLLEIAAILRYKKSYRLLSVEQRFSVYWEVADNLVRRGL
jgi:hypothetical protein